MVSIIIVSFNTKDLLRACLSSVQNHLKGFDYEIIVVDNYSNDGSSEMVKTEFKEIMLIENKENVGFGKANNIGAKKAKGEALLFLNSDTQFVDDSLKKMVSLFGNNEKIGVVGGKLKNASGAIEQSAGKFYSLFNLVLVLFGLEHIGFVRYNGEKRETDWVSGGCMLVRRSLFEKLKGFDENMFMYVEDMEFCYRVKKEGFAVWYYPKMKAIHISFGSSNKAFAIIHIYQGILYFYKKHMGGVQYEVIRGLLVAKAAGAICIGIVFRNKYVIDTYKKALRVAL